MNVLQMISLVILSKRFLAKRRIWVNRALRRDFGDAINRAFGSHPC